jgi:hypothetical protein
VFLRGINILPLAELQAVGENCFSHGRAQLIISNCMPCFRNPEGTNSLVDTMYVTAMTGTATETTGENHIKKTTLGCGVKQEEKCFLQQKELPQA